MQNIIHFLLVCQRHTESALKNLLSECRAAKCLHSVQEASIYIAQKKPVAVVSEMELEDANIWNLVTIIRSGKLCPSTLPIIGLTFGEHCPALDRLAALRHVYLYHNRDLSAFPQYLSEILAHRPIPPSVLLIEDDNLVSEYISEVLGKSFSIQVAPSASCGFALLAECEFDLVILDLCLPDLDGVEVLERILAIKPNQAVLVLSGYLNGDKVVSTSLHGATLCADKEILAMPQVLMRKCLEAIEFRNLDIMLRKELCFLEQSKLVSEAKELLALAQNLLASD